MAPFELSVFINCPFDEEFAPLLQAMAFCVTDLGYYPRLAPENADNAANRLDRIVELVRGSKYAIHDLSRCKSASGNEYARMNMPFELGIDHGCRRFGEGQLETKAILILEETRFDYHKALSDIAGWDIRAHGGDHIKIVRHVRDWLVHHAGAPSIGASKILSDYDVFQAWYVERELASGASKDDIREYPTVQMVQSMREWVNAGRPIYDL
jgi:hypothetical protein